MKTATVPLLIALTLASANSSFAEARQNKKSRARARDQAKKECLSENSELKGRALKACIKEKRSQR